MPLVDPATIIAVRGNVDIEFDKIQGNSFGGFSKDDQSFILLEITNAAKAKTTLGKGEIYNHVKHSSSEAVIAFNEQFRALRRKGASEGTIKATWTNLVFTKSGIQKLGGSDLHKFPKAFKEGMAARAAKIGDVNDNKPANWNDGMAVSVEWEKVDAMVLVASDDPSQLNENHLGGRLQRYLKSLKSGSSGLKVLGVIRGETRRDDVGHEHFGFKDGVSQPGVRGVDGPDDPIHNPDQGNPGQDLLHPGEFVLGYPRQIPIPETTGFEGPNRCQGARAGKDYYPTDPADSQTELPDWAVNGSFLVFRRLAQDVKGFRDAVDDTAFDLGITPDLLGAKIVGRFKSGAPLEPLSFQSGIGEYHVPMTDPGIAHPALAGSDDINNHFEYGDDKDGKIVPLASHIRKAYPRDQEPTNEKGTLHPNAPGAESRTQTHRLLRRGIPFGDSLGAAQNGGVNDPRGLLFVAYQTDIERQFEFVQESWVNDPDFPENGAGQDPIIANSTPAGPISGCPFHQSANAAKCPVSFKHFVKTRGGGYFFSPSIETLAKWLGL